jgi:hypothetical protein
LAVVCSLEQYMATLVEIILMQTIGAAFVEQEHSMSQFDLAGLEARKTISDISEEGVVV